MEGLNIFPCFWGSPGSFHFEKHSKESGTLSAACLPGIPGQKCVRLEDAQRGLAYALI